jgi:hypothetical protein
MTEIITKEERLEIISPLVEKFCSECEQAFDAREQDEENSWIAGALFNIAKIVLYAGENPQVKYFPYLAWDCDILWGYCLMVNAVSLFKPKVDYSKIITFNNIHNHLKQALHLSVGCISTTPIEPPVWLPRRNVEIPDNNLFKNIIPEQLQKVNYHQHFFHQLFGYEVQTIDADTDQKYLFTVLISEYLAYLASNADSVSGIEEICNSFFATVICWFSTDQNVDKSIDKVEKFIPLQVNCPLYAAHKQRSEHLLIAHQSNSPLSVKKSGKKVTFEVTTNEGTIQPKVKLFKRWADEYYAMHAQSDFFRMLNTRDWRKKQSGTKAFFDERVIEKFTKRFDSKSKVGLSRNHGDSISLWLKHNKKNLLTLPNISSTKPNIPTYYWVPGSPQNRPK